MKGLNFLAAFIGGAAIGAAFGILFAPEKGEDTRQKIKDILREKGIKLNRSEMDELVDKIAAEVKDAVDWFKDNTDNSKQRICRLSVYRFFANTCFN